MNNKNRTSTYTIGLDLSDRKVAVCVIDAKGKILEERSMPNEPEHYKLLARTYPKSRTALETGSHSPWVSRLLEAEGLNPIVANARKLRSIYDSDRKSDKGDARMLAKLARVDPSLLSPVKHRSENAQRDLIRMKTRDALVRNRVNMINSVRFLLKSLGVRVPSGVRADCFVRKTRAAIEEQYVELVEPMLLAIDCHCELIKKQEKLLKEMAEQKYPVTELLQTVHGVGPITSLRFVLIVEDPDRFAKPRDVGPFLGLTPKMDQSGDTDKQLRITKAGNADMRKLLVNCAQHVLGVFGKDSDLRESGLRLCERGAGIAKRKAVVATARKIAVTMVAVWKSGQPYKPFRDAA